MNVTTLISDLKILEPYSNQVSFAHGKIKVWLLSQPKKFGLSEDDILQLKAHDWVYNAEQGYWFYMEN